MSRIIKEYVSFIINDHQIIIAVYLFILFFMIFVRYYVGNIALTDLIIVRDYTFFFFLFSVIIFIATRMKEKYDNKAKNKNE